MKIGFFLPNATFDLPGAPEVGGIETFAFTVGEAMQKMGHEVVLFGGKPKGNRSHRATSLKLELFDYWETKSIPDLGTRFQRLIQRLHFGWVSFSRWNDYHFDLAILSKPFDWPLAYFWKKKNSKQKIIMGFHGTDFFYGDRCFFSSLDASFAVSPHVAKLALAEVGVAPVLIPNPVDFDFFKPSFDFCEKKETFELVSTGRLIGWKGFDFLLDAVASLDRETKIHCHIVGEGPEKAKLEAMIKTKNLEKKITLTGQVGREQLYRLLVDADAYVAPSIGMEAFSIASLEAAATGLPLLLSDQVGLADFLDASDFISYPNRDVQALKKGIKTLMQKQEETAWKDRQARHLRLKNKFSPEIVAQKILDLANLKN